MHLGILSKAVTGIAMFILFTDFVAHKVPKAPLIAVTREASLVGLSIFLDTYFCQNLS